MHILWRTTPIAEPLEVRTLLTAPPIEVQDLQPDAVEMPTIHAILQTTPGGVPLEGDDAEGDPGYYDIEGFLDTGTSGILIDSDFASQAGIPLSSFNGQPVTYNDTGVAGSEGFGVSTPLIVSFASSTAANDTSGNGLGFGDVDPPELSEYTQSFSNLPIQISRDAVDPLLGPVDIFGTPAMQGKVVVIDPTPTNDGNVPSNFIYNPGTPFNSATEETDPGIPSTNLHVKLSYASFLPFTTTTPLGATAPIEDANPFIGPNPLDALSSQHPFDNTPPVSMTMGSKSATGSFLFDTGAQSSFISQAEAAKLGVSYAPGTFNTADADLVDSNGDDLPNQFQEQIGGLGSTITAAGFYMDSLTIPTIEGPSITFLGAPVLVVDVTVTNPTTQQSLTLDGDFGSNFLMASYDEANVLGGLSKGVSPDLFGGGGGLDETPSAFDWITFDQPHGILGLDYPGITVTPWPTATSTASNLTSGGAPNYTFTVNYSATSGQTITPASIGNSNLMVTGPHGFSQMASVVSSVSSNGGAAYAVTYKITAPAGGWSASNDGDYTINMQPNQVQDSAADSVRGQPLAAFSIAIAPPAIPSTSGADTYYVQVDPASNYTEVFDNTPSIGDPTYLFSPTALSPLTINGSGGNDSLTIDFSNGNPLTPAGVSFDGGTGANSLAVIGSTSNDSIIAQDSQLTFNDVPVNYANTQAVSVNSGAGSDDFEQIDQPAGAVTFTGAGLQTLTIDAGTYTYTFNPAVNDSNMTVNDFSAVNFAAAASGSGATAQTLASLVLGPSATATLLNPASHADRTVLVLGSLAESSTSKLDLGTNDMIVQNGNLANLTTKLRSGQNLAHSGYWNGFGIISSSAAGAHNTALGIEQNSDANGGTLVTAFDGQPVNTTSVLVKYTYYGDANLDGKVDSADYALIDNGLNMNLASWRNGDFNYDNAINGDDYTLIDNAFNTQGSTVLSAIPAIQVTRNTAQLAASPSPAATIPNASVANDTTDLKKHHHVFWDLPNAK